MMMGVLRRYLLFRWLLKTTNNKLQTIGIYYVQYTSYGTFGQ